MISILSNGTFLTFLAVNVLLAAGLYPMVVTGQLSVGQAGFMAVGAYASSWANVRLGWPIAPAVLLAIVLAAVIAVPVAFGTNRVKGVYLIIGTLAVGEIIRITLTTLDVLGGVQGYTGMDVVSSWEVWLGVIGALIGVLVLMRSRLGLAMRSIRDDEDAAATAGIATRKLKAGAVVFGAGLTGLAGALFAHRITVIAPEDFGVQRSFAIALFVLFGGSDSLAGPVVGAFLLTYLPEAFEPILRYRELFYGVVLLGVMIFSPRGLITRERVRGQREMLARAIRRWRPASGNVVQTPVVRAVSPSVRSPTRGDPHPVLTVRGLGKRYGGVIALSGVDLEVRPGEILGLIGPNGAGKTTLVDVATGLVPATTGTVSVGGEDVSGYPTHLRIRAGLGRTFQDVRLFRHLCVEENVAVATRVTGDGVDRTRVLLERFDLTAQAGRLPDELAFGVQRRVQVAQSLGPQPIVLFLDEPSTGLNEAETAELALFLTWIRDGGTSIVLIDHNLDLVMNLADRVVVLDHGEKLAEGTPGQVRQDRRVQEAYLGLARGEEPAKRRAEGSRADATWLLQVANLASRYGKVEALRGVSLRIARGETVAVVGRNGAGKTTLLRSIFGFVHPYAGSVRFAGDELAGRPPHTMARRGIAYIPEHRAILGRLTVRENLELAALGAQTRAPDRLDEVFDLFPALAQVAKRPAATLSGGQQHMLSIGRGLVGSPRLLMLDEPSLGLAPRVVTELYEALGRLCDRGTTILLVEQNVHRAMSLASRGYLMHLGRIEMEAGAAEILTDPRLFSAYLGALPGAKGTP